MMLIANTLAIILRCAFDGITANECGQFFTSHQSLLSGILSIVFCVQIPLTAPPIPDSKKHNIRCHNAVAVKHTFNSRNIITTKEQHKEGRWEP